MAATIHTHTAHFVNGHRWCRLNQKLLPACGRRQAKKRQPIATLSNFILSFQLTARHMGPYTAHRVQKGHGFYSGINAICDILRNMRCEFVIWKNDRPSAERKAAKNALRCRHFEHMRIMLYICKWYPVHGPYIV